MTNDSHIQSRRDTIQAGSDVIQVGGDYVAGNKIVHIYQTVLRPVPIKFSTGVQRMVEDYTAIFGGRDAELARLDTFLTEDERPFGLLIAPTGRGKTALLIHWLAHVQQQHTDWRVVFAPISIRYQTASEQVALNLLAHTLAEVHNDLEQFRSYDQSPASLRALVGDYLRRPLPDSVRLLVVLDGLDEATGWQVSRELFPRSPGSNLKIVVAARDMAHRTRATWHRELGFERQLTCDLELEGLTQAAVRDLLQRMGNPLDHLATDVDVLAEIERVSQGDPVTIRLLVELLQAEEIQPGQLANVPADDLNAVLDLWLEHLREHEREHERVYALLSLVATAYGPLTTADGVKLDGTHLREPRDVEDAARAVARFVIGNGTPEQGYVFSHQKLREVYREQRLGAAQQRFVQYGEEWYNDRSQPLPDYLRQFWVAHLQAAEEWDTMRRVLTEIVPVGESERYIQPWADARYRAEGGSYAGYLNDLDVLWQWADAQQDIALGVRCALIHASIRSLIGNLTPELLVGMVTVGTPEGKWSAAAALEHIRQMPDSRGQAESIKALVETDCELPWEVALEVARAIRDEQYRAHALATLVPNLPQELHETVWQEALAAARAIRNKWNGAHALAALVPNLPQELFTEVLSIARTITDSNSYNLDDVLRALAPRLPETLLRAALSIAQNIRVGEHRDKALCALAPYLPPEHDQTLLHARLNAINSFTRAVHRAEELRNILPKLSSDQHATVLAEAQNAIYDMKLTTETNTSHRVHLLCDLLPYVPSEQHSKLLEYALFIVTDLPEKDERDTALYALVPYMSLLPQQKRVEVLSIARDITDNRTRARTLDALAPYTSQDKTPTVVLRDALAAARAITNNYSGARNLCVLMPHLPAEQQASVLHEALKAARAITDNYRRARDLCVLMPHLPAEQQASVLHEALEATRAITDNRSRADALRLLAPHLPPEQQASVLHEALEARKVVPTKSNKHRFDQHVSHDISQRLEASQIITDNDPRAHILCVLAPHLSPNIRSEVLHLARAITDNRRRADALRMLAPHLSAEQQSWVLNEALEATRAITHEYSRSDLVKELDLACDITNEYLRSQALVKLARRLPPALLVKVLHAVRAMKHPVHRADTVCALAPHLPPDLLAEAFQVVRAIPYDRTRTEALCALAPHLYVTIPYLPPDLLAEVLYLTRTITDESSRAKALSALVSDLPLEQQSSVLVEAIEAATRAIINNVSRIKDICFVMSHLPTEHQSNLLKKVLEAVRASTNADLRAKALHDLVSCLPSQYQVGLWAEAFQATFATTQRTNNVKLLETFLAHLVTIPQHQQRWDETRPVWYAVFPSLARRGRPALLSDLTALTPWLEALATPDDLAAIAQSIIDVSRCWP